VVNGKQKRAEWGKKIVEERKKGRMREKSQQAKNNNKQSRRLSLTVYGFGLSR
jgi:hypothetical protein